MREGENGPKHEAASQFDAKNDEAAKMKEIMDSADWESPAGTMVGDSQNEEMVAQDLTAAAFTYNKNNDVIAIGSADRKVLVAPWTPQLEEKLGAAGFTRDEKMGVPYSSWNQPTHPDINKRWVDARKQAEEENDKSKQDTKE